MWSRPVEWAARESAQSEYVKNKEQAEREADKAYQEIAGKCQVFFGLDSTLAFQNCLKNEVDAYQKKEATNQDLKAQVDMTFWAKFAFFASAASVVVGSLGFVLLILSLRQTRQAITNDREIGEAQVRAYVHVEVIVPKNLGVGQTPTCLFFSHNSGASPAKNLRHIAMMAMLEHPLPDNQPDLIEVSPGQKPQGSTLAVGGPPQRADVKFDAPLSKQDYDALFADKGKRLYVAIRVFYDDVFKKDHETKVCVSLVKTGEFISKTTGGKVARVEWELSKVLNDAT
jgi:hypothetical protein